MNVKRQRSFVTAGSGEDIVQQLTLCKQLLLIKWGIGGHAIEISCYM